MHVAIFQEIELDVITIYNVPGGKLLGIDIVDWLFG